MELSQVRALIGARVSHVQGEEKTSHLTQRSKGDAYRESQGWTVAGYFEDLDVSAIKLSPWERPDLARWLADDKKDEWDALVFAKTDRVFRSAADCIDLARWCEKNRKILVLIDDGIKLDYFHPEDDKDAFAGAMSKVFLILASVFAEIEGKRFVQRAKDRVSFLRKTDRWGYGVPPFGYLVVDHPSGKGKSLGHDLGQQIVLHWIASQMIKGESLGGMVSILNRSPLLSPRDWGRSRNRQPIKGGTGWTVGKLKLMLTRPSTQGVKMLGDKPTLAPDGSLVYVGEPSFDEKTWEQLQIAIAVRSQDPRDRVHSVNPQLGIGKCGLCTKNLRQRTQTGWSDKVYRYYLCNKCRGVSIVADTMDMIIEQTFLNTKGTEKVKVRIWQTGSDNSAELEQTKVTIESLREDRALGLFTSAEDQELYRSQMQSLVARRDTLKELPTVKAGWIETEADETYADVWGVSDGEARRKMVIDAGISYYLTPQGQVVSRDDKLAKELKTVAEQLGVKVGDASSLEQD